MQQQPKWAVFVAFLLVIIWKHILCSTSNQTGTNIFSILFSLFYLFYIKWHFHLKMVFTFRLFFFHKYHSKRSKYVFTSCLIKVLSKSHLLNVQILFFPIKGLIGLTKYFGRNLFVLKNLGWTLSLPLP